jgi:hypothetical protein
MWQNRGSKFKYNTEVTFRCTKDKDNYEIMKCLNRYRWNTRVNVTNTIV